MIRTPPIRRSSYGALSLHGSPEPDGETQELLQAADAVEVTPTPARSSPVDDLMHLSAEKIIELIKGLHIVLERRGNPIKTVSSDIREEMDTDFQQRRGAI